MANTIPGKWLETYSGSSVEEGPPDRGGPPGEIQVPYFREIVRNVLFPRKFVKTYNVVLVICLLLIVLRRFSKRRENAGLKSHNPLLQDAGALEVSSLGTASAASSTGLVQPNKDQDETKPLLGDQEKTQRKRRDAVTAARIRIRGILCYQPPSIGPYETATVSTLIVVCIYYGLNLFYTLYRVPFHSLKMFVFADRLGSIFVINLPLLYLLAAKNPFLRILTGWSYERVNVLHRAAGRVCVLAAIGHFGTFLWVWSETLSPFLTLRAFLAVPVMAFGLVAWSSYILLGLTSKEEFRNAFYEVFLFLHVVLQALALGFLYFHHHISRPYVLASAAIFVADRILYRFAITSHRMPGEAMVLRDGETVRLSLVPPKRFSWEAGDHAFLSIPKVAILHPHPFSIASLPPTSVYGDRVEFLVRARSGFSKKLLQYAQYNTIVEAVVDGPYGSPFAAECLEEADVAFGVCGGSGIAVIYPLIHRLAISYGNKKWRKKIVLMWVVREDSDFMWLPDKRLDDLTTAGVEIAVHVTSVEMKRPDMKEYVRMIAEQEGIVQNGLRMGVAVCGPSGMVRDVRNGCARLMRRGDDVDVVAEKFGW